MLTSSWRAELEAALAGAGDTSRIAVVGIGQELYGDDNAGCVLAQRLAAAVGRVDYTSQGCRGGSAPTLRSGCFAKTRPYGDRADNVLVLDAGPVPESQTGALRRFGPDWVILVDAARMDLAPGSVRWLAWDQLEGMRFSSHTLPLDIVAHYLSASLDCRVGLIGIQPGTMRLGDGLTAGVQAAVEDVAQGLEDIFVMQETARA